MKRFGIILLTFVLVAAFAVWGTAEENKGIASSKALRKAVGNGDLKAITALLEKGADVNGVDQHGNTLLVLAAERGHLRVAELLIQHKSVVKAKNMHGRTALMAAISVDIAHLLLEHGADIESIDNNGWPPLMHAAIHNNTSLIKFFIEKEADVNAKDRSGRTTLMMLMSKGSKEAIEWLLDNGAGPNATNSESNTALMGAAREGRLIIAALLIRHGADVSVKNKFGKTARKIAKENGLEEMADFLRAPDVESVLSGPAQIYIDEPFLESLLNENQVKNLFGYREPTHIKIKVSSQGKEGTVTMSGSIMTDRMFSCSVIVKAHESPSHASRYFQGVNMQFRDILKKDPMRVKRLGDISAAFYQDEMTVMLFLTLDHIFVQVSLMAPKEKLIKVTDIAEMVEKHIRQPKAGEKFGLGPIPDSPLFSGFPTAVSAILTRFILLSRCLCT